MENIKTRARIEGEANEGCVTERSETLKNEPLNIFRKLAYIKRVFDFFGHFMHNYAIKSLFFTKLGNFHYKKQILSSAMSIPSRSTQLQTFQMGQVAIKASSTPGSFVKDVFLGEVQYSIKYIITHINIIYTTRNTDPKYAYSSDEQLLLPHLK